MRSKVLILLTVLVAFVSISMCSGDSDADTVVYDGELSFNSLESKYMVYDGSSFEYLQLSDGAYDITLTNIANGTLHYGGNLVYYASSGVTNRIAVGGTVDVWYEYSSYYQDTVHCVVKKIDCYIASTYYDDVKTLFDVKVGPYTYSGPDASLVMGDTQMWLNPSGGYIPDDYDDAYFFVYSDSNRYIDPSAFVNTPESFEHDMLVHNGDSNPGDEIYIPKGTYKMKFSMSGDLRTVIGYTGYRFDAGVEKEYEIESGMYRFETYSGGSPVRVHYNISPDIAVNYIDSSYDLAEGSTSTQYMWYVREITLDAGSHRMGYYGSSSLTYFFDYEHEKEQQFLRDVVGGYLTSLPYEYERNWEFSVDSSTTMRVYALSKDADYYLAYSIDDDRYATYGTPLYDVNEEFIYVSANKPVTIAVDYDSSKYIMFLKHGDEVIALPDRVIVELTTDVSKEYLLLAESKVGNSIDAFQCQYEIYVDGLPESDDNAVLFAVVSIAICAVFFGLLLLSGRKPKWDD